jgi:hypothetical protein
VVAGIAMHQGMGTATRLDGATIAFSTAGAVAALAVLPFTYTLRAAVAVLLGAVLMVLGLQGSGPLAGLAVDGGQVRDMVRLVTVTVLPAALMLRARYAGYSPSRWIVAGAFVASVPFLVLEILLAAASDASAVARVGAIVAAAAVVASLFGLGGDGSLGSKSPVAWLILGVLPTEIGLRELTPLASADVGWFTYPLTALSLLLAAILTSMGTYQLGAAVLGPRAQESLKKKLRSTGRGKTPPLNLVAR